MSGKPVVHAHQVDRDSGWNNARWPCSCCVCIPDAGSDGDGRSSNDAKWFDPATDLTLIDPALK
jgi:hypothetical protein